MPEHRIPEVGARIMDLQDPTSKMSTTGGSAQGTVYVLDEAKAIEKKFKSAVTDSGSEVRRAPEKPGVSNLIEILAAVRGQTPEAVEAELKDARYGELKDDGRRGGDRLPGAGARSLYRPAGGRGRARGDPRRRRRARQEDRGRDARRRARAHGRGRAAARMMRVSAARTTRVRGPREQAEVGRPRGRAGWSSWPIGTVSG